ncbi:hypothetical protein JR316_0004393 [Psilocybe cubensis]|uniref:Uncharacterized protein n=2 Tax=Psilocybe cubensis TaxID=181762 RepID=A0A8H7Y091_PSICU|nr:hypothetical protein JR316_0004393 [Psilocybe cubensis]KAH9482295.1 hypothetical protein JR316_0004393 [Psilocybe cubensis]
MQLAELIDPMRDRLQRALDELASSRSTLKSKMKALQSLERELAQACFDTANDAQAKDAFMALQYTFECNIPSHLLPWIVTATARLEALLSKSSADDNRASEAEELVAQLSLSLSLIQGVVLNHEASKHYLGRRSALEILLDLLLASRHVNSSSSSSSSSDSPAPTQAMPSTTPPLTSIVLDTLLCILVDSSKALRAFEEANGVQSIVKILKRAGTPREVRMKCLEFLYFYLLDETPSLESLTSTQPTPPPTAPATPARSLASPPGSASSGVGSAKPKPKPYLNATPMRPSASNSSRFGSSIFPSTSTSSAATSSPTPSGTHVDVDAAKTGGTAALSTSASSNSSAASRSTSGSSSSNHSFSSSMSASTNASSMLGTSPSKAHAHRSKAASPVKVSSSSSSSPTSGSALLPKLVSAKRMLTPITNRQSAMGSTSPPTSPPLSDSPGSASASASASPSAGGRFPQLRSMMMLRKEVDYVPLSPTKPNAPSSSSPVPQPALVSTPTAKTTVGGHKKSLSASASLQMRSRRSGDESGMGMGTPPPLPPLPNARAYTHGHHRHQSSAAGLGKHYSEDVIARRQNELEKEREKELELSLGLTTTAVEKEKKRREQEGGCWKTTEEKKELLGTMLGNVDALVEGVRKAGIWGLG